MSSHLQIADALGFTIASGVGGALVGLADRGVVDLGPALAVVFLLAAGAALVGTLAARGVVERAATEAGATPA